MAIIKVEYLKKIAKISGVDLSIKSNFLCYWVKMESKKHSMQLTGFVHNFQSDAAPQILDFIKFSQKKSSDILTLIEMQNDFFNLKRGSQYLMDYQNNVICDEAGEQWPVHDQMIKKVCTIVLKSKK